MLKSILPILILILAGCSIPPPLIDQIKDSGELLVLSRNSGTTLYEGSNGLTGLEYDLVNLFSLELGVKPRFILPDSFDKILPMLMSGKAHLAAAGLTITPGRETKIRFGPAYQEITQQVVYLRGKTKPRKVEDLIGKRIEVLAGSSHQETMLQLLEEYPDLDWTARNDLEIEELLQRVEDGKIDYTIADSNEIAVNRRFLTQLNIGFDLAPKQSLAWALPHSEDSSLYKEIQKFFNKIKKDGTLDYLLERHYGYVDRLDFVESQTFLRHIENRLPEYVDLFKQAETESGIDWRMLASVGYQESHWDPNAKSPTGVRGIMMLTLGTADLMDVKSRLDPEQSILGGARYLNYLESKLPERIQEPDRFWLALAGYNVGFGHLEDARILTKRLGGDPDKWSDLKKHLPKLSLKKWHSTLKHGYARGNEPVIYVDNIRAYSELLAWHLRQNKQTEPTDTPYGLSVLSTAL